MSEPRIALVTGGSRGIGRAVVESLLEEGLTVYFCSRSQDSVDEALGALAKAADGRVFGRVCDVRELEAVCELVSWVDGEAGRIDVLVNNAGLGRFGPVDTLKPDDWELVLRTNLDSAYYFTHTVAPIMMRGGGGWIFNIASLASVNPFAGGAAYNASKFGLLGLSEASMLDLRPHDIRVAAILPGSVDTDFRPPGRRSNTDWMLQSEDIARAVVDLLRFPGRALPSRIDLRPTRPPGK